MADSYLGFQGTMPNLLGGVGGGSGANDPVYLSTMVLTNNGNNLILSPGSNTPTTVDVEGLPVITSLLYRTTDVFFNGGNLTTIDGNLDINSNVGVAGGADINGTLNVDGAITMPGASQYIELNPANNTGWGNTFLNTNIYQGFKKGGGGFNLTAPEFVSYPTTFTVGGILYPATLIELTSGILNINGVATTTITGATCAINAIATEIGGTLTVAGLTTFTGQQTMNGNTTVNGAMEANGTTTLTGAVFATGTNFTATTGTNTLTSGANTITAVGTNTITGGLNLLTGGVNTYTALQHYFVGDLVDFTSVLTSTCTLRVDTIESSSGMELINVSSINGVVYPPPGSGGTTISTFNQLYTSSFKANTAQISSISSQQLFVSSINGSAYPPTATQTISSFNTASVSSLIVSSINNAVYPPPATTSNWANFNAVNNVSVPSPYGVRTNYLSAYTIGQSLAIASPVDLGNTNNLAVKTITNVSSINGAVYPPPAGNTSAWATFAATSTIQAGLGMNMGASSFGAITNCGSINGVAVPTPLISRWASQNVAYNVTIGNGNNLIDTTFDALTQPAFVNILQNTNINMIILTYAINVNNIASNINNADNTSVNYTLTTSVNGGTTTTSQSLNGYSVPPVAIYLNNITTNGTHTIQFYLTRGIDFSATVNSVQWKLYGYPTFNRVLNVNTNNNNPSTNAFQTTCTAFGLM